MGNTLKIQTRSQPAQAALVRKPDAAPTADDFFALTVPQLFAIVEGFQREGKQEHALAAYQTWLKQPEVALRQYVLFNLGALLQSLGRLQDGKLAYQEALEIDRHFSKASINLGLLYERLGEDQLALRCWSDVVASQHLDPKWDPLDGTAALNHIGRLQEQHKKYALAESALEHSLRINPNQPAVIQHWVHIRQKACRWPVYKDLPGISANQMLMCTSPLAQLAMDDDPVKQLLTASSFVERTYSFKQEHLSKDRRYNHQRLRLGYVSGDLCVHAVGLLLAEFLEAHDKSQFMLYGYDYSVEDHTAHRARLRAAFEVFRPVAPLSDRDIATLIVEDEIDILVDLHGLSSGARPGIFALNPGVLQGTYLGFIGTTGMPWLDFVVSDRHALPDELATYFVEKPLYLEGSFIPLTDQRPDFKPSTRQENGLPEKAFVMASFGNVYKINEPLFSAWVEILQAAPGAVLWLVDDNESATANLRQFAASRGVGSERLIFTPRVTHQAYRGNLRLVDLFLDTFPYNCGSTTNDVLEAGVPLLTCQGRTMVSRMGASILRNQGQDALVTSDLAEYKALAIRLANGQLTMTPPAAPAPLRAHARQHMVRSLEAGLVAMLQHKLAQR